MPLIRLNAAGFPPATVPNGRSDLVCTWSDLVWAAITVGKRELFHVVRYGQYSFFEIVFRAAILFANLKARDNQYIERSQVYDGQDPSEKAATSYFLGLASAKLVAARYLGVPWLMHLDVYRHRVAAVLTGRSRPDLIGQNVNGDWVVIESKGRTGDFDIDAMNAAKRQASQITTMSGAVPYLYSAVQAHFSSGILNIDWHDPSRDEEQRADIDISKEDLQAAYYRPFERMLEERPDSVRTLRVAEREFRAIELPDADITVGVDPAVIARARAEGWRRPHGTFPETRSTIGSDGVLVQLGSSWDSETMQLEPQQRSRVR